MGRDNGQKLLIMGGEWRRIGGEWYENRRMRGEWEKNNRMG